MLRTLIGDSDAQALRSLAGPSAAELTHVVPELRAAFPESEGAATYDSEKARFHLYETVCRVLAARGPLVLVLVLDDLHWADPSSLQLLGFAVTQLAGSQILVVGTYRDTEIDTAAAHPRGAALAALARQGATRVALGGLARPEMGSSSRQQREPSPTESWSRACGIAPRATLSSWVS